MSQNDKPNEDKKEKDDKVICRECGKEGHLSYNCPKVKCYNCGKCGHKQYDCKERPNGYQRGRRGGYKGGYGYRGGYGRYYRDDKCYNCGKYGHKSFECDKPNGNNCYICGKPGHISKDCPDKKQEE